MRITKSQRRGRSLLKRVLYSQLYLRDAFMIMIGRGKPLVKFKVEADPPSVYLNFAIPPEKLEAFERELDLPLPLTPISCIEGEEPFHCLTLNVYRVSGLVNGIRAEWSVYVSDAEGIPRYLVVEAQSDVGSLDPVNMFTKPGPISYTAEGDVLRFEVGSENDTTVSTAVPSPADAPVVRASPEWVEANDYIYWRNGVCDRTFYDTGLANARTRSLDPATATVVDGTPWSRFTDPVPRNIVVFDDAIEFAMSPWWNIRDLAP
jgi:hypothetical protein